MQHQYRAHPTILFDSVLARDTRMHAAMRAWRILRRPFPVPFGHTAHACAGADWEIIDLGLAGCLVCGVIHVCRDVPIAEYVMVGRRLQLAQSHGICNGLRVVHTKCIIEHDEYRDNNQSVCSITGCCIREQFFADHGYECTLNISKELLNSQRPDTDPIDGQQQTIADRPEIFDTVHRILASSEAQRAHTLECDRIRHKLQNMLVRIMKLYKQRNTGKAPNLVCIATELAAKTRNVRLCPNTFEHTQRKRMVKTCCEALRRLLATLQKACPAVIDSTQFTTLITGLLYLMRTGLSMRDVSLLPRVPELVQMLPLESALQSVFGMRSKCITEIENIVKVNLRALDEQTVSSVCMRNTDEVRITGPASSSPSSSKRRRH